MESFFRETWFLWWLLALVAIVRWYWVNLKPGGRASALKNDDRKFARTRQEVAAHASKEMQKLAEKLNHALLVGQKRIRGKRAAA